MGLGRFTRWARLRLARLTGDELIAETHGARIAGTYSSHYQYLVQLPGGPHPFQLQLFVDHIRPGMTVLDVGAHIGVYTTLAARRVGPAGHVVAVEPDARNAELVRKNATLNGVTERVRIVEAAAGETAGTVRFYRDEAEATGTMGSRWQDPLAESRAVDVRAVRLDEVLDDLAPDVVKVDVQGSEVSALNGLRETLGRGKLRAAFVELNAPALERAGSSAEELLALLRDLELEPMLIDEERGTTVGLSEGAPAAEETENLICLPG